MAIMMITGLPGNAKTLYAIGFVKAWAEREGRPVYYSGIKDCTLPGWLEFDPVKWMDCPAGSIIFIDECQKTFRNRSLGAHPPLHVTELEEHRHRGVDFVMITQHPSLVDPAIRKLTQTHKHMVRVWGMEVSTVHRWDAVRDNCDKPSARKDSEKLKWKFDRSLYGCYHSADLHTMKRRIPGRVWLLVSVPVLLLLAGYFVVQKVAPKKSPNSVASSALPVNVNSVAPVGVQHAVVIDPIADAKAYVFRETPRVVGLPQTAPKYDELTKPVRVPVPAACVKIGTLQSEKGVRCKCYTQQGTPMQVGYDQCLNIAQNGFFQDFDADPASVGQQVIPVSSGQSSSQGASNVVLIPDLIPVRTAPSSRGKAS